MLMGRVEAWALSKWMRVGIGSTWLGVFHTTDFWVVVGQGKYKLRKDNGEKLKKTYDEGDLSLLPKLV